MGREHLTAVEQVQRVKELYLKSDIVRERVIGKHLG